MGWIFRKKAPPARVRTRLGVFTFDGNAWYTDPAGAALIFGVTGNELDLDAIDRVSSLLPDLDEFIACAVRYAKDRGGNAWDGRGDLKIEEVNFTRIQEKSFGLTFAVSGNPDFTVTVEFKDGKPCEVWGAD